MIDARLVALSLAYNLTGGWLLVLAGLQLAEIASVLEGCVLHKCSEVSVAASSLTVPV